MKKSVFRSAHGYQGNALKLPVKDVDAAQSFYETVMGFEVTERGTGPCRSVVLSRDGIRIALEENGGDPAQDGCFFEVDDVETAFAELRQRGLDRSDANFRVDRQDGTDWKVFFVIAPDGLCYCLGQKLGKA